VEGAVESGVESGVESAVESGVESGVESAVVGVAVEGAVGGRRRCDILVVDRGRASDGSRRQVVNDNNLVWVDMEMTGLVPEQHRVIEIATIVTDSDLNELAEGPVIAIHQPEAELAAMDEWNTRTHTGTGLVDRVRSSVDDEASAIIRTLEFLRRWVPAGKSPMCGNSICQDRRFMARHLPELEAFFHYRNLDVSTLKILASRWLPELPPAPKRGIHLALDDIRESIEELRYYREHFLRVG